MAMLLLVRSAPAQFGLTAEGSAGRIAESTAVGGVRRMIEALFTRARERARLMATGVAVMSLLAAVLALAGAEAATSRAKLDGTGKSAGVTLAGMPVTLYRTAVGGAGPPVK